MSCEDIIRMVREANRYASKKTGQSYEWHSIRDEYFAALVAAAEREECAKVCDEHWRFNRPASECADAIRARGER